MKGRKGRERNESKEKDGISRKKKKMGRRNCCQEGENFFSAGGGSQLEILLQMEKCFKSFVRDCRFLQLNQR